MKLALVFGLQQGNALKPRLQGIKDNLNIDCFDSVPLFIDTALKRNSIYDRILVLSTKMNEKTINDLYSYWGRTSKDTEVVMLCKAGADDAKAKIFLDTFMTPVASAMLVTSTTVQTVAEAVLRPTAELTADYGIKDFLNVEIDDDAYVAPEPVKTEVKREEPKHVEGLNSNPQTGQKQSIENNKSAQKGKKGFFSGLFGKKNKSVGQTTNNSEVENEQTIVNQQMNSYENNEVEDSYYSEPLGETDFNTEYENQNISSEDYTSNDSYEDYTEDQSSDYYSDYNNSESEDLNEDVIEQEESAEFEQQIPVKSTRLTKKSNINSQSPSLVEDVSFEGTFEEVPNEVNDFEPEMIETDVDFGETEISDYTQEQSSYEDDDLEGTDESFESDNISSEEEQYRMQSEAPKVITKTVVKEVVRNVNVGNKLSVLNGVYAGRLKKVIVVTGDRGSGVTSTALSIAKTLAKKVDVLYFDCDVINHGLLNYIDYTNFKNYENTHMNGVKLCKGSQAFDRCVVAFDENFYLLTTDYSCDTTDEELKRASEVVAERADDFGVVVVDCPVSKLSFITDLVLTCQGVICTEGSKRGFMNMLCQFESCSMPMRYKRTLVSRGTMLVTKCPKSLDLNRLISYIKAIYEPEEVNWLATNPRAFDGRLSDKLLNEILEG